MKPPISKKNPLQLLPCQAKMFSSLPFANAPRVWGVPAMERVVKKKFKREIVRKGKGDFDPLTNYAVLLTNTICNNETLQLKLTFLKR